MSHNGPLAGKSVIITGASSGIGRAIAQNLAGEGARLFLVARSADRLEQLAKELAPAEVVVHPADLTDPAQVEAAAAAAEAALGLIDVLIANAGLYSGVPVAEASADDWDRLLNLNVTSTFRLVQRLLIGMMARGKGDIIVTSSVSGHQAIPWEPVYSASKHAVQSFVHGVRRQAASSGVRVGAVAPGIVLNELWGYTSEDAIEAKVAAREGLRSEDVAEAVLFMLSRPPHVTIRDLVILPQNQDI
jgi:ribitol 2-dehydrogenase